jgi:hypothetical protein
VSVENPPAPVQPEQPPSHKAASLVPVKKTVLVCAGTLLALVLLVTAGCGSNESSSTTNLALVPAATVTATTSAPPVASAADDRRLARQAVLTLSDFPGGWTEKDDEGDNVASKCAAITLARRTLNGRAVAGTFSKDQSYVSDYVYVYQDERRAKAAFEHLTTPAARRCEGEDFKQAIKDEDGYSVGELSTSSLNVDPLGSDSAAGRIVLEYTSSDIGVDNEASIDIVVIREGRALALINLAEDVAGTFDEELRARLSSIAARRLRDLLQT